MAIRFSAFQTSNNNDISASFVVGFDPNDTTQTANGSTVKWDISSVENYFWSASADYDLDLITPTYTTVNANSATWGTGGDLTVVNANSADWESSYTTVNTNSASWGTGGDVTFLSGGTVNQIFTKNSSDDYIGSWKNRRTNMNLGTVTSTSSIFCNALSADQFTVSLSGISTSATFSTPYFGYDAQLIMWNVKYLSNTAAVSLSSSFRVPSTTLNWSLSSNKMDIFAAKYDELDNKWDVVSFIPGYSL